LTDILRQRIHVSIAIEGNTNSSFLTDLGQIYGPEHVLIYKQSTKKFFRLSELPYSPAQSFLIKSKELLGNRLNFSSTSSGVSNISDNESWYARDELPEDTAAVHGTFNPGMFFGILENPFVSIILKDPLERMITLYEEWSSARGEVDWRVSIPYKSSHDFSDFAFYDKFNNFQSKCLGSRRLGDFDLVGVAECVDGFIAQLKNKDWTGYIGQNSREIKLHKSKYQKLGITQEFLEKFQIAYQLDYAIYQQAVDFIGYCK
jgi:hypothetical protein